MEYFRFRGTVQYVLSTDNNKNIENNIDDCYLSVKSQ